MNSSRIRLLLTYGAAVIFGVIVGATLVIRLRAYVSRSRAVAMCSLAMNAANAGKEDTAIIMLAQAGVEDRDSYVPWQLLGQVYSRQNKPELSLDMYKRALTLLERKRDPLLSPTDYSWERGSIQKRIDEINKEMGDQQPSSGKPR